MQKTKIGQFTRRGGVKYCNSIFYECIVNLRLQKMFFCNRRFLFDNTQKHVYES